jgi:large subunit ribosomal protein L25
MKESFVVTAKTRTVEGTGASRRLRRTGEVPAVVYGGKEKAKVIQVNANEMWKHLQTEAFYSHILTLALDGAKEQVVLKDMQRHPVTEQPMHIDFQRVLADVAIRMLVPLHFKGGELAPGVKVGGGVIEHHLNTVEVECLPGNLPEFLEVDTSAMELNDALHLSQLKLPEGVALVELKHGRDPSMAALHMPRAVVEEEPVAAAATAEVPALAQKAPDAAAAGGKPEAGKDAKKDDKKK